MVWFIGYLYYLCITCEKKIKRPAALKYWIMFLPLAGHWIKLVMFFYCSSISSIIFFLAHSGQMMFSPSYVLMYIQIVNGAFYIWQIVVRIYAFAHFSFSKLTWMKPLPTMESLQRWQKKHSLCQANVSKATNLVLPSPPLPGLNKDLDLIGSN